MRVIECGIELNRICSFLSTDKKHILQMYKSQTIDTEMLLKWSKLLEYDFFRIYTQHLILYSPPSLHYNKEPKSSLPSFRKHIYTKEIIDFVIEQIATDSMTRAQVIEKYKIPSSTLHKWLAKHKIN